MRRERAALEHLGWIDLCEHLASHLATGAARDALERTLSRAIDGGGDEGDEEATGGVQTSFVGARSSDARWVRERLAELDGLEVALTRGTTSAAALHGALASVVDVRDPVGRARHGARLGPSELAGVRDLLRAVGVFLQLCDGVPGGVDEALAAHVAGLDRQGDLLRSLAAALGEGAEGEVILVDDASPALARARQRIRDQRARLRREAEAMLRDPLINEGLRDRYFTEREGRVVLPIRADAFSRGASQGIIHDSSQSGGTLFVEPTALIAGNNALREAHLAAAAEEGRLLDAFSRQVGEAADGLFADLRGIVAIDAMLARLRLSQSIDGVTPRVIAAEEAAAIELPQMRHPLLLLAGVDVVANDLRLERGAALIVSGPNAGGKTVALKCVGLAVLLAQAGIRVPTSRPATVPLFRQVVTDVGDDQSLFANLSTFSAHIAHVREALAAAASDGAGTLVLLDEIAVGTDPGQGAALAESILHHLTGVGATVVTTTHYERLKNLAGAAPRRYHNAAVGFDLERMAPTFRVTLGVPGPSSAFAVGRRLGVPEPVVKMAEALADEAALALDRLLLQVNSEREALATMRAEVEAMRAETEQRLTSAREREAAALAKARSRKQRAYDEAAIELRSLRAEVQAQRKRLRELGDAAEATTAGKQAERALRERLHEQLEPPSRAPGAPPRDLEVGDRVTITTLGRDGEVVGVQGSRAVVLVGNVRTTVDLSALRRAEERPPEPPPAKVKRSKSEAVKRWSVSPAARYFGDPPEPAPRSIDNTVDLRGERAEDALRRLEAFVDQAMRADQDVIVIQHGFGSGALRQVIREHLGRLQFVRKLRPGLTGEGGEGVTIAWIDA
ncbi:MAG: Smr/MutS family protein [Nannocystaceae bacterium]